MIFRNHVEKRLRIAIQEKDAELESILYIVLSLYTNTIKYLHEEQELDIKFQSLYKIAERYK